MSVILRVLDSQALKNFQLEASFAAVCFAALPLPIFSGTLHGTEKAQMLGCKINTGLWLEGDFAGWGRGDLFAPCC